MSLHKHGITIFWSLIAITLVLAITLGLSYSSSHIYQKTNVSDIVPQRQHIPETQATSSALTILIGGDIMLDRSVRKYGETHGYDSFFSELTPLFKRTDIVVANLEGPITSSSSRTVLKDGTYTKSFAFTFATTTGELLSRVGVSIVSLANNHTDNFGPEGFAETQHVLTDAGVKYFGSPWNYSGTEAISTMNDIPVAFVGYHQFASGFEHILADVKRLSAQGYFVIVMPHWGTEYATTSSELQRTQAHELVAAGARTIIGSHPHVIQEHEMIGDVPVYYSLGNLVFDQYFSTDVTRGNLIQLKLTKDTSGIHITHTSIYETEISRTGVTLQQAEKY